MISGIMQAMIMAGDPWFDFATNMGVGRVWLMWENQVNKMGCGCGCGND